MPQPRPERRARRLALVFALFAILAIPPRAAAWDSATHRLITRLALDALPPSPLKQFLSRDRRALQDDSVIPDTLLKERYGAAEKRRHYINLEYFGADPLRAISPDIHETQRRFGARLLMRAGTLPWTIEDVSADLEAAFAAGDCSRALTMAGYLSHYVGDLSQPLHTTKFFDGYLQSDRGVHARFELAVDHSTRRLDSIARPEVRLQAVKSVWDVVIDGLRESNLHVAEVIGADRAARRSAGGDQDAYRRALMSREQDMVAHQIADSASRLTSIWFYEWEQAGRPTTCASAGYD